MSRLGGSFAIIFLNSRFLKERRGGLVSQIQCLHQSRTSELILLSVCVCLMSLFIWHVLIYCLSLISPRSPSLLSPSQPLILHMSVLITNSAAGERAGGEMGRRFFFSALSQMTTKTSRCTSKSRSDGGVCQPSLGQWRDMIFPPPEVKNLSIFVCLWVKKSQSQMNYSSITLADDRHHP